MWESQEPEDSGGAVSRRERSRETASADNSSVKRGGATDQLPAGDVRSEGAFCVHGRGSLSVTSLPHHGSHPISVQDTMGWEDSGAPLRAPDYRPFIKGLSLKGAESCFLPVVSVLETPGAAEPTHLELRNRRHKSLPQFPLT